MTDTVEIVQADRDLASWFTRRMGAGWSDDRIAKMLAKHRLSHSSTPSEVERLREALKRIADPFSFGGPDAEVAMSDYARAALTDTSPPQ